MEQRKDGLVTLSLSSDEIEEELANMEDLEEILLTKLLRKSDRDELKKTFRVAMTAMKMVWVTMQGDYETEIREEVRNGQH